MIIKRKSERDQWFVYPTYDHWSFIICFFKEGVKKRQKNFAYDLEGDMGKRCLAEI
jgi:hypothetical protein